MVKGSPAGSNSSGFFIFKDTEQLTLYQLIIKKLNALSTNLLKFQRL